MRCVVAVALIAMLGCGKPSVPAVPSPTAKPAGDPVVARREADVQAAFSIDAACASIEQALADTKKLAPVAGGDAKEALLNVAEMLDSAGATLADHNEEPPPLHTYRKEESEQASERQKAVTDALDALQELRDAHGILADLSANVPAEHKQALDGIEAQTGEAVNAVEDAIGRLGGKVPPLGDEESAP
ncbi:hypothetical protein EON82_09260 [bacterium]|nr:MAG: hypothetical protein EON82_09260 [bacterium]